MVGDGECHSDSVDLHLLAFDSDDRRDDATRMMAQAVVYACTVEDR